MLSPKRCMVICPNPSVDILASADMIHAGQTNRLLNEQRYPGGKGIHVALALAELGVPTTLVGIWGEQNGRAIIQSCRKLNKNLLVTGPFVEGWNRNCYTIKSDNPEWKDTEILGTGPVIEHSVFEYIIDLITGQHDQYQSVAVCGSWPKGAQGNYIQLIIEHCKSYNLPVYIDCTGIQLKNALKAYPFCVHLNKHEVTHYFNENFDSAKYAMKKLCNVSAITNGSRGLYLISEKEEVHANVKINEVKSAVGSGDCLLAGIIKGFYEKLPFDEVALTGAACGAANCLEERLGMLNKEDVKKLMNSAITNPIEQY